MEPPPDALPLSPDGSIAIDVNCLHCGYNLRGLLFAGRCPECGTPIGRSVHGNLLRFADPQWLRRLLLGVRLALWNVLVGLLGFAGACVGGALLVGFSGGGTPPEAAPLLRFAVFVPVECLSLASLWLITSQEPRVSPTEDPVTLRRVLRGFAILGIVATVIGELAQAGSWHWTVGALAACLQLGFIVSFFGWFVFMRRFARRIPDWRLARSTTVLMWGLPSIALVLTAGVLLAGIVGSRYAATTTLTVAPTGTGYATSLPGPTTTMAVSSPLPASVMMALFVLPCTGIVFLIVFGIWYVLLLFGYRRMFATTLGQARELAAEGEATGLSVPDAPPALE